MSMFFEILQGYLDDGLTLDAANEIAFYTYMECLGVLDEHFQCIEDMTVNQIQPFVADAIPAEPADNSPPVGWEQLVMETQGVCA